MQERGERRLAGGRGEPQEGWGAASDEALVSEPGWPVQKSTAAMRKWGVAHGKGTKQRTPGPAGGCRPNSNTMRPTQGRDTKVSGRRRQQTPGPWETNTTLGQEARLGCWALVPLCLRMPGWSRG